MKEITGLFVDKFKKLPQRSFSYIVFMLALLEYFFSDRLNSIKLGHFIPNEISKMILQVFDFFYSPPLMYVIVFGLFVVLFVLILISKTVFFRYLPGEKALNNGNTESWNYMTAIKRTVNILLDYLTVYWQWFFIFNVFFNWNNFINDFWVLWSKEASTSVPIYYSYLNLLLIFNVILLFRFLLKMLFNNTLKTMPDSIDLDDMNMYTCLTAANILGKNGKDDAVVGIFKSKHLKKDEYYLVVRETPILKSAHSGNYDPLNNFQSKYFRVESMSFKLEDIRMQFDAIKDGNLSIPVDGVSLVLFK